MSREKAKGAGSGRSFPERREYIQGQLCTGLGATRMGRGLGKLLASLRVLSISTYRLRLAPSQKLAETGRAHDTGAELP
jgi:hypothetical protein